MHRKGYKGAVAALQPRDETRNQYALQGEYKKITRHRAKPAVFLCGAPLCTSLTADFLQGLGEGTLALHGSRPRNSGLVGK